MRQIFESLGNLFFPKVCLGCDAFLIANETLICTDCRHQLPLTKQHLNPENEGFQTFVGRVPVAYCSAMLYFQKEGRVQHLIHNLKYKNQQEVGTILGLWYADDLKNIAVYETIDEIIPVALHKRKQKERGYNQLTTFGNALSKTLNIPYNPDLLVRKIYSKTQSRKSLLKRSQVLECVFDVNFTEKNHNKHFLLIDDVLTTGATLEACCKALLKIPGTKISIVCMAMAQG